MVDMGGQCVGVRIIIYIACCGGSMDKRHERNKNMSKRVEDLKYCRGLKDFLRTFKTSPCLLEE